MPATPGSASTALPSISTPATATASLENDGSNFQNWKYRVSKLLALRGLTGLIDGTELKP